ncbi:hypothetical protein [uncultured Sphingomonas sp.]|uniref:hypothetical protein n=1 Tax=uncultured Sphingomonas sp. TaxID=158754 RepID=UPI0025E09432|nr:hypothetical protein [uncultured Sphingomonas sp.]
MDPNSTGGRPKRQPVPAGGQPTPAVIDAADATPPAAAADPAAGAGTDQASKAAPTNVAAPDAGTVKAPTPTPGEDAPNDARAEEPAADTSTEDEAPVEARVLVAFDEHDANDIVTAPAAEIERLKLAGNVDPHPDAVAYAKRLAEDA